MRDEIGGCVEDHSDVVPLAGLDQLLEFFVRLQLPVKVADTAALHPVRVQLHLARLSLSTHSQHLQIEVSVPEENLARGSEECALQTLRHVSEIRHNVLQILGLSLKYPWLCPCFSRTDLSVFHGDVPSHPSQSVQHIATVVRVKSKTLLLNRANVCGRLQRYFGYSLQTDHEISP